jgi:hypothetical protein
MKRGRWWPTSLISQAAENLPQGMSVRILLPLLWLCCGTEKSFASDTGMFLSRLTWRSRTAC